MVRYSFDVGQRYINKSDDDDVFFSSSLLQS